MRLKILLFVAALSCGSAYAVVTGTESGGAQATQRSADQSAWEKVTTTVKTKLSGWLSAWTNSSPGENASTSAPAATPVNTASPASEASHTPVATAPAEKILPKIEGSSLQEVQAERDKLKSTALIKATPGRAGTTVLPKTKGGVPVAAWSNIRVSKKVPLLDIGTENTISRENFTVSKLAWGTFTPPEIKKMPPPASVPASELALINTTKVIKPLGFRGLQANVRGINKPVTLEQVQKVAYTVNPEKTIQEMPYKPLSPEMMKMVAALILLEKSDNNCYMVMGLFHELKSSAPLKLEAAYHLGACAAQMKFYQSAYENLTMAIVSGDKDYNSSALAVLARDLPNVYEKNFFQMMKGQGGLKSLFTAIGKEKELNPVYYHLAKGAYRSGEFKTSGNYSEQVTSSSAFYDEAQFLSAMNSFALNDKSTALKKLQDLWKRIEPKKNDSTANIRALTSLNLARMYFATKKYDKAFEHYMQVPKNHPLWVEALIEQGWTQIALEDFAGAIGNMYSLHSPYFKAVFQPESFVVRSIGYLNICQYGDAYRTLSFIEKDYRDWSGKLGQYLQTKNKPAELYATIRSYIKGKSSEDLEGVPYQIWREMAHRKEFLNMQTALNDQQDEMARFEGVNSKIKEEKAAIRWRSEQAKKRFDQLRAQIAKAQTDNSLKKNVDQWRASMNLERDLTISYRFQLAVLEQGREAFLDYQRRAVATIEKESAAFYRGAGEALLTAARSMQSEMMRVLDNNELLRYEVFAGSGENIRYQVAGGEVSGANRIPASIRPTKMLKWSFDGEFWEDEIGAYRSSLQNLCPKSGRSAAK
jgi:hypothetical protein